MTTEAELAQIAQAMSHHAKQHAMHMRAWHRLKRRYDALRPIVERQRQRDLREARRHCGPETREAEAA